eukprot:CAMPEP_0172482566 /NCGR_PEP_ID=MMETSP1066-20121228/9048_1 /TAXON_ID=671091 /ORGANISM="Coscinodiscus wailesii, Strain CCMP2513" /LENGTH=59 /DNA_ID=CAMNT_0013245793 /DNA_START=131 /DNA_END=307 /DNA_ORIENTATION=+
MYTSLEASNWVKAKELLHDNLNDATQWVVKKDSDGITIWRRLPIHEACLHNPTDSIVKS